MSTHKHAESKFKKLKKLGKGSYGIVYKAENLETKQIVALKAIPLDGVEENDVQKEIDIMLKTTHPNIVKCYSYFKTDNKIWIEMEYCSGGSLLDIMARCKKTLHEQEIKEVVKQALQALSYLHNQRRIHRDIKCGNLMLNDEGQLKLGDFGVSAQLNDTEGCRRTTIGSPYWMAPEMITQEDAGYNEKVDIWSLGITIIEMAQGRPPLYDHLPLSALFRIPTGPPPTFTSPEEYTPALNSFLAACLIKEPDKRPSSAELQNHIFLTNSEGNNILAELTRTTTENDVLSLHEGLREISPHHLKKFSSSNISLNSQFFIIGTPSVGEKLIAQYDSANNDKLQFQWYREKNNIKIFISEVHGSVYVPLITDIGYTITCIAGNEITASTGPITISKKTVPGSLKILLVDGKDLMAADINGLSDPYCVLAVGRKICKSKVIKKSLNPVWNQEFEMLQMQWPVTDNLSIKVWDRDWIKPDDAIGDCIIELCKLPLADPTEYVIKLENVNTGRLHLKLTFVPVNS